MPFETPHPLGIANDLPWGGYFLEQHIILVQLQHQPLDAEMNRWPQSISIRRISILVTDAKFIFQVETVGDKYMAVSGLPTRCSKHAVNIANLALDMIDIVQEVNARGRKMQVTKYENFQEFHKISIIPCSYQENNPPKNAPLPNLTYASQTH